MANKYSLPLLGESQLTPEQIEEFEIERKKETRAYQCFTETAYFYNRKLLQNQVATQWVLDNYAILGRPRFLWTLNWVKETYDVYKEDVA